MYLVEPARPEEAQAIANLVNSAYRGESSRAGWTTEADLLEGQRTDAESLRESLTDPRSTFLLLRDEASHIIGCINLEHTLGGDCYLGMLTISPTRQARGAGRHLLEAAENYARLNWNSRKATMGVIQLRDSLIAWYERCGYKRTGATKPFPYGNERFGLPKRDDMYFVILEKNL